MERSSLWSLLPLYAVGRAWGMGQREAWVGERCTAITHMHQRSRSTCNHPCYSLGAQSRGTKDSLTPNISMHIWASVKFSVPLAIFYFALQHHSSGPGHRYHCYFSTSCMLEITPYYYAEPKKFTADTRSSMNKKAN